MLRVSKFTPVITDQRKIDQSKNCIKKINRTQKWQQTTFESTEIHKGRNAFKINGLMCKSNTVSRFFFSKFTEDSNLTQTVHF